MFFLASVLLVGAFIGLVFGIVMSVWMWRTRPSRQVPEHRKTYVPPVITSDQARRRLEVLSARRPTVDGRRRLAL